MKKALEKSLFGIEKSFFKTNLSEKEVSSCQISDFGPQISCRVHHESCGVGLQQIHHFSLFIV